MALAWSVSVVLGACATVPPTPAHTVPYAYRPADQAPEGQGSVLIDVTNVAAEVRVLNHPARCATPCVLKAPRGAQELEFSYAEAGRVATERAPVIFSAEPQVYRRTVHRAEIHSRPGRIVALALWGLSYASAITALGLLAADERTPGVAPARRGLGLGSLVMLGSSFWLASRSVRRSTGVGTLFPWTGPATPAPVAHSASAVGRPRAAWLSSDQ